MTKSVHVMATNDKERGVGRTTEAFRVNASVCFIAESRQDIHSLRGSMTNQSRTKNVNTTLVSISAYHAVNNADNSYTRPPLTSWLYD